MDYSSSTKNPIHSEKYLTYSTSRVRSPTPINFVDIRSQFPEILSIFDYKHFSAIPHDLIKKLIPENCVAIRL